MNLKKIAEGRTAEVFSFADGKILKLYRLGFSSDESQQEVEKCNLALKQGLPTPRIYEVIQLNGQHGIVFEKCHGSTMGERLRNHPNDVAPMAKLLAEFHIRIHECSGEGLPSIHDNTRMKIDRSQLLDDAIKEKLKAQLSTMPSGKSICHGDFHPDNVFLTEDGPVVIDWIDATMGPSVADMVRTILLISYCDLPSEPKQGDVFAKIKTEFVKTYQAKYLELKPLPNQIINLWTPILAGSRLSENAISGAPRRNLVAIASS